MKAIVGRKMGMTEVFTEDGQIYAVTVVEVLPNVVTQVKTVEKDGYDAIQVGYEELKESRANKCEKGIAKKANTVHIFKAGDVVDVIGTSKGHGYSGVIKRWNQHIGPKGHGSGYHRGQGTFANNGRYNHGVMPGKHMSGHYGNESATVLNQLVVAVDAEKNYILVRGGLPGARKSIVVIRSAIKDVKHPEAVKPLINRTPVVETAPAEEAPAEAPATEAAE